MKVSLITLHRVTNFGSMLQTYATQEYLKKLGYDVEVIDYYPIGLRPKRALFSLKKSDPIIKKILKFLPVFVCNATELYIMNRFVAKYIQTSQKQYKYYSELQAQPPQADVYISGSDQIWNTQNNNGFDDLKGYYLCFAPNNCKKISYASSFGKTEFSEDEYGDIAAYLKSFTAVSVRENTALKTLKRVGIENGVHVLDPTFLLSPEEWLAFSCNRPPKKGYLFVYNLNRNKVIKKYAKIIAQKKQLRIVNFADTYEFIPGADNRMINTPVNFVEYIANADYVITDSFHGTAFSLNFNRQFICVAAPKYNCRLESILAVTGLEDRMFDKEVNLEIALKEIDYQIVNRILAREEEKSKDFLAVALEEGASCV